jgi:hypothetical protein
MPREPSSIPLPRALLDAVDDSVGPDRRSEFVSRAVSAALLRRKLFHAQGDPGVESWWPLEEMDFVLLSSGEAWLQASEEE